jgi:cysteinyl-tRNA synthetase
MSSKVNDFKSGNASISSVRSSTFELFKTTYIEFMENVLGIREEEEHNQELIDGVVKVLIDLRKKARLDKNFALSDKIRDDLKSIGVQLMDGKEGDISYTIDI